MGPVQEGRGGGGVSLHSIDPRMRQEEPLGTGFKLVQGPNGGDFSDPTRAGNSLKSRQVLTREKVRTRGAGFTRKRPFSFASQKSKNQQKTSPYADNRKKNCVKGCCEGNTKQKVISRMPLHCSVRYALLSIFAGTVCAHSKPLSDNGKGDSRSFIPYQT